MVRQTGRYLVSEDDLCQVVGKCYHLPYAGGGVGHVTPVEIRAPALQGCNGAGGS
jgi:hypothetical protein